MDKHPTNLKQEFNDFDLRGGGVSIRFRSGLYQNFFGFYSMLILSIVHLHKREEKSDLCYIRSISLCLENAADHSNATRRWKLNEGYTS